jgi:hypothetical protein
MSKEILDQFGKIVITEVYNDMLQHYYNLICGSTAWGIGKEYTEIFQKLSADDQNKLLDLHKENLSTFLFAFLKIFEENTQYKINIVSDGENIDLASCSEMLKAEPIIEGGWIDRFSNKNDLIITA